MTSPPNEEISLAEEKLSRLILKNDDPSTKYKAESIFETYQSDFDRRELYMLALTFYAENKDKEMYFSHENKVKLEAFKQQITHGKFSLEKSLDFGVLDGIGKDSRLAWENLGDVSKEQAMDNFVILIDKLCPLFKTFVEVTKIYLAKEANLQNEEELQKIKKEKTVKAVEGQKKRDKEREKTENSKIIKNEKTGTALTELEEDSSIPNYNQDSTNYDDDDDKDDSEEPQDWPIIVPPEMWTNKNIDEFKNSLRKEISDAVIKVCRGETVTVRVPTREDASCFFWEFATDGYDIGFGVYFEWSKPNTTKVSVRIKESDDEDEDKDDYEFKEDLECGDISGESTPEFKPSTIPISVIIPVCRRDSHEEVIAGSHQYPGEGVYLLKFSNSYSLWRSKTLYYRVYYTKPEVTKQI